MSPHKQAWQHSSSPRGTKFPQRRCRGYPQCLPMGHPESGGTSPGHRRARSPLPSLGPIPAALTAEAQLAELGQSHRGLAEHLLEIRDPEGSEATVVIRVGIGNPRPRRAPRPSELPIIDNPHPAQRSPGTAGRGKTPIPTQTPTPTCSGAAATWRPRSPFPARRINAPAGNAARRGGCGMCPAPAPPAPAAPPREGVAKQPAPHRPAPALSPAPARFKAPFLRSFPAPSGTKLRPIRPAHSTKPRPQPASCAPPRFIPLFAKPRPRPVSSAPYPPRGAPWAQSLRFPGPVPALRVPWLAGHGVGPSPGIKLQEGPRGLEQPVPQARGDPWGGRSVPGALSPCQWQQ